MRTLALGLDHRSAPTAVREALAFEGQRRQRGLDALKDNATDAEFVLLSTCNRVELYAAAEADPTDGGGLAASLARSPRSTTLESPRLLVGTGAQTSGPGRRPDGVEHP